MEKSISCSWCHHLNLIGLTWCEECGHRADRPRQWCDCPACLEQRIKHDLEREDSFQAPTSKREDALTEQLTKRKLAKEMETK